LEAAGGAPAGFSSKSSRSWVTSNSSVNHITEKGAIAIGDSQALHVVTDAGTHPWTTLLVRQEAVAGGQACSSCHGWTPWTHLPGKRFGCWCRRTVVHCLGPPWITGKAGYFFPEGISRSLFSSITGILRSRLQDERRFCYSSRTISMFKPSLLRYSLILVGILVCNSLLWCEVNSCSFAWWWFQILVPCRTFSHTLLYVGSGRFPLSTVQQNQVS
jgi:hypothetical protein